MKRVDDFRLKFGKKELVPIMVGGMGVDISTAELALEAARLGGVGHISDAMVLLWLMFAFALLIIEPFLFKNHGRIVKDHDANINFRKTVIAHWIIFILSLATIFVSALGAHGFPY